MLDFNRFRLTILCVILSFSGLYAGNTDKIAPNISSIEITDIDDPILNRQFKKWEIHQLDANALLAQAESTENPILIVNIGDVKIHSTFQNVSLFDNSYFISGSDLTENHKRAIPLYSKSTNRTVSLTVNKDFLYGFVTEDDVTKYIEPLWYFLPNAPKNQFIVYHQSDVIDNGDKTCGVTHEQSVKNNIDQQELPEGTLANCHQVDIAIASDYSMFQKYGTVAGVENHNIAIMNNVQTNYIGSFSVDLILNISTQYIVTTSGGDPWTSSNDPYDLLPSFRTWGNGNGFGSTNYDIAELWSDRNFTGSTIGLAYVGGTCGNSRYHVLEDFSNNAATLRVLVAHEMGHNFDAVQSNSGHDAANSGFIMAPSVSTSTTWSPASISDIDAYIAPRLSGCLPIISCSNSAAIPSVNFVGSPTNICVGSTVQFTDLSTESPTSWLWSFPGGTPSSSTQQNPIVTYNTPGIYDVQLTATNSTGSNTGTIQNYITVAGGPSFTASANGLNASFNNTTSPPADSYSWDFGDPASGANNTSTLVSPSHAYPQDGVYLVTLTAFSACGTTTFTLSLSINTPATSNFTATPTTVCTGNAVQFTSTSSNNATQWNWTFPGGTPSTSTLENPSVVYNSTGNYNVTLIAASPGGADTEVKNNYITVIQSPIPGFSAGAPTGNTVSFTNTTNPLAGNTYSWDFGDGSAASSDIHPTHTFPGSGTYTVTLNVTSSSCGTNTTSQVVQIANPPVCDFSATPTSGCGPLTVQFTDLSTNQPTTWSWSFPGGNPSFSTIENPTVTYNNPGQYNVSLSSENAAGTDTKTVNNYITVSSGPTANFTVSPAGNFLTFTNTSSANSTSYLWDFGDGSATSTAVNPTHTYSLDGTYTVTLTATNPCGSHTVTQQVVISDNTPTANISVAPSNTICAGGTINFTANVSANTQNVTWTFTGGSPSTSTSMNPIVTFATPGSYSVTLTAHNGASTASANTTITVLPTVTASFNESVIGVTTTFTSTSSNATSYSWDFGDGNSSTQQNPTHTYAVDGDYTVCLTATGACGSNTTCSTITIFGNEPSITVAPSNTICNGETINYTANVSTNTQSVSWTFAGGTPSTSTSMNPSVTYNTTGTHAVTLTAHNGGNSVSTNTSISVLPNTTASFASGASGLTANFTNTSTNATSYSWDFGDSNSSTLENPSHTYVADGTYTVCLIATGPCGTNTTCSNITISGNGPSVNIQSNATSGCQPLSINYHADVSNNTSAVQWTFGGGSPGSSSLIDQTVVYNNPGTYLTTLVGTNPSGTSTDNLQVTVHPIVNAEFSATASGPIVNFTDMSSGNPTSYSWDFGDGNSSTQASPSHQYNTPGSYTVCLTVTNACGSHTSCHNTVITSFLPSATIETNSPTTGCEPMTVNFHANVSNSNNIMWTFEGGTPTTSTLINQAVVFTTPGNHAVTLTATNSFGTVTATPKSITVNPKPIANFNIDISGHLVTTDNTSQDADSYVWDFGDGTVLTTNNPGHLYTVDTVTNIQLIATNGCGSDSMTIQASIGAAPAVNPMANITSGCAPLSVDFQAQSQNAATLSWSFPTGSPTSSSAENPTVVFNTVGTHSATVTATNALSTATQSIEIVVLPETVSDFNFVIDDHKVTFTSNSTNSTSLLWVFGDNTTAQNVTAASHDYGDGEFTAMLIAIGPCNSDTTYQHFIFGSTVPPTANIQASGTQGCTPFNVTYTADITNNTDTYSWTFPGGSPLVSTDSVVTVTYNVIGDYIGTLIATNDFGSDTAKHEVSIIPHAEASFTMNVSGLEFSANNNSTNADTYFWTFGDGDSSTLENPTHTYAEAGSYDIVLQATNACGTHEKSRNLFIVNIQDPMGEVNVSIYPNPSHGIFTLDVQTIKADDVDITIFDILGRKVLQKHWSSTQKINEDISIENQPSGNYIFQLNYQGRILTGKIIKM